MKRILVSNDDGINSEGLIVLAEALKSIGEVYIVAPDRERSAASHSLTLHRPLRAEMISHNVYAVDGTPTDCINLAVNGILHITPDLVVSGINKGGNLGDDVTYSGTVSAAIEGTLLKIPSFAISLFGNGSYNFKPSVNFAVKLASFILENGLPKDTLLNVNLPNVKEERINGYKITKQGKRAFSDAVVEKIDPRGKKYYWIAGNSVNWQDEENTDFKAIKENYVSITPLHLDLTNYPSMEILKKRMKL